LHCKSYLSSTNQYGIYDNTQPSARVGRKAYRVLKEDSRVAEISIRYKAPAFFVAAAGKGVNAEEKLKNKTLHSEAPGPRKRNAGCVGDRR
jgi:hypothetical protein